MFSFQWEYRILSHTCIFCIEILSSCFSLQCYGTRQLSVDSLWVKALDHVVVGCFFSCRVSGHLAGGCLGSWRAPPWFLAVAVHPWSRHSFSNHAPACLTGFTCKKGFAPIRESCTDFHFSSIDDGLTGPGYIDQLACEQKKTSKKGACGRSLLISYRW